jgi:hypothetical protein
MLPAIEQRFEALAASAREQGEGDDLLTIQTDLARDSAAEEIPKPPAIGSDASTFW